MAGIDYGAYAANNNSYGAGDYKCINAPSGVEWYKIPNNMKDHDIRIMILPWKRATTTAFRNTGDDEAYMDFWAHSVKGHGKQICIEKMTGKPNSCPACAKGNNATRRVLMWVAEVDYNNRPTSNPKLFEIAYNSFMKELINEAQIKGPSYGMPLVPFADSTENGFIVQYRAVEKNNRGIKFMVGTRFEFIKRGYALPPAYSEQLAPLDAMISMPTPEDAANFAEYVVPENSFAATAGGFGGGAPAFAAQTGYGAPQQGFSAPSQSQFDQPMPGFGDAPTSPQGFGAPAPQQGFAPPQPRGFDQPMTGFGEPQNTQAPTDMGANNGFNANNAFNDPMPF